MKRVLDRLSSLRLTLALLLALAGLFLAGLFIPQKWVLQRELYEAWRAGSPTLVAALEALGLTDVYRSPIAWILWGAFFVNLAVVMGRRVPGTLRRIRLGGGIPDPAGPGFTSRTELPFDAERLPEVRAFFEARGCDVEEEGGRVRAVKNRFAPLATLAFHLSFFVIAGGATLSVVTRFTGEVDLGQGEFFSGALEQYARKPTLPRFGEPPSARFLVESIEPEVEGSVPTAVRIRVRDERGILRTFEVNDPYEAGGAAFVFKNLGVAPLFVVTDAEGRERFAGFMRLNVLQGRTDRFTLLGQSFTAQLFPDYVRDADGEGTRSQEMRDPVLRLTVESASGRSLSRALRPGETMPLGPYAVAFVDWRFWVKLYVRSERGLGALWFGFALGSAAVAWRLFRYRREYVIAGVEGGEPRLAAGARAEYYRALFADEAEATFRALEAALSAPPSAGE